jgi:cytochrome c oxidase subunit 2
MTDFPIFPEQASSIAAQIDALFLVLTGLSLAFAVPVVIFLLFFAFRYRQGRRVDRSKRIYESFKVEFAWSFIPFMLGMTIFGWGAFVYYNYATPPADTLDIYVIGKQWMWHNQHPSGKSEINDLHIPVNRPVKLIMTSQDVIHSYFIPAFRIKQDVLPGRYTTLWFEATKTGEYHMFCTEYCGTEHSRMGGTVYVLEQNEYQNWLGGGAAAEPLEVTGERVFQQQGCLSCHSGQPGAVGPGLVGIFGEEVEFQDGSTVVVDESYLRESMVNPQAKIVAGYAPVMPTYENILSEDQLLQLIAYIKSLAATE